MNLFSQRVFGYAFGIALSVAFAIALAIIVAQGVLSVLSVLVAILASLAISAAIAALIAGYRLPLRWGNGAYRAVMRRLAKKAIRASVSQAMTPVECLGIMEREGYVYLRLAIGSADGIAQGFPFQLLESTDNQLWGIVEVVNVEEHQCDCIPSVRLNEQFWASLESSMWHNTSPPPNVHLIVGYPPPIFEDMTVWLLDNWR